MNKKIRVLIDGAGGDVGQGILKSLIDSKLNIELFAACISDSSSWLYKINNSFIFPYVCDEIFIEFLINFLNKHKINIYFPSIDSSLIKIAENKRVIEEQTNAKVFIDDLTKIKICDDKFLTNQFLKENNFLCPKTTSLDSDNLNIFLEDNSFPLILKTKSGNGAKNIIKVDNYKQIEPFIGNNEWLLQELLDTNYEITSGIYIGKDKELKGIYVLKRTLKLGSTHHAERIIDENLEKQLIDIAKKIDMQYLNIQAVYKNNKLFPFEFNGRLSGTTGVMREIFNTPELFIRENILNEYIKPNENKEKIFFTRYNEEIIYTQKDIDNLKERSVFFEK